MSEKIKWNSEKLLGISAMSISFITLLIFVYQTNLMRKQNYLSILPYLSISTSNSSESYTFGLSLENHGVGPAIIESVKVTYLDKQYDLVDYNSEVFQLLIALEPALDTINNVSHSTLDPGLAIPVNTNYNVVKVKNSPYEYELFTGSLEKLLENGLYFEIVYRSIQDERWLISNETEGPEKL